MRRSLLSAILGFSCTTGVASGADAQNLMPQTASGWSTYAPRTGTAPTTSLGTSSSGYALNIAGSGVAAEYGGWTTQITGLQGSAWYRFTARAVATNVVSLREAVTIVLKWNGSFGEEVSPDYVWAYQTQPDGSLLFDRFIQTPSGTTSVDVRLVLQWSPNGQLSFDSLAFAPAGAPPARKVRVAAIYYRPSGTSSGYASVQAAADYAKTVANTYHPDVMVMGETLNNIGAPGTLDSKAESVPGPSTDYVAGVARTYQTNIVFGLVERVGTLLYNTAVLIDRTGSIIGKHHKVQLPLAEAPSYAPGDSVPVFDTDFGRVAMLICQDTAFTEPAREAALKGAEMLLVPIWGGKTALVHARAIENSVYVAASGYDYASEVVNPLGTVLASVRINSGPKVAIGDIDLSQRFRETYLGDWRDISNKERRSEPYQYLIP